MISIFKKEFNSFFGSLIAYLVIGVFLLVNSLFLWVFNDGLNILNSGFADLNIFFFLSPWMFLFLIPAITMKSFSDEFSNGTIEILKTRPLTNWNIIFGKFFACLILIIITLIPTLIYLYSIWKLANPVGNIDLGSTLGSYLGLLFLAASYISIGLFCSILSKNQIIAFILSVFITFFLFYGLEAVFKLLNTNITYQLDINNHYKSISRGVIDSRDIIYFFSITSFFLFITKKQLDDKY